MKKHMGILLVLALLVSLAACGQPSAPKVIATAEPSLTTEPTAAAKGENGQDGVYYVSDVEALLAAIGPDREIWLEPGTYDLTTAGSYGKATGNPHTLWQETYDGYELVIQDAEHLAIRGMGTGTVLVSAQPRYANVLVFRDCKNLSLSDITAGHTPEQGACVGGVIWLEDCKNAYLWNLGLYGCGVTGVTTENCTGVSLMNSDIYECSYNGIQVMNSRKVRVDDCRLFHLAGGEYPAFEVFNLSNSTDIAIQGCEIYDNDVQYLVRSSGVEQVFLEDNVFRDNQVGEYAFGTFGNFVTLEGNTFEDNTIRQWFAEGCGAVDAEGNTITGDMLNGNQPEEAPVAEEKVSVTVQDVDAFLAAIAPNTEIVLDGKVFDLSTAKDYGGGPKRYYYWEDNFDGPGLVITGVENLTIRSKSGNRDKCTVEAVPRYANVLSFRDCENLVLSGFTAGHTVEPGYCTGGVIFLENCERIAIGNCGMYGCGILGVQAFGCTDITMQGCEIYECSYGGVQMIGVTGVVLENCTFRDLGGNNLQLDDCSDVVVDGEFLSGQHYDGR